MNPTLTFILTVAAIAISLAGLALLERILPGGLPKGAHRPCGREGCTPDHPCDYCESWRSNAP